MRRSDLGLPGPHEDAQAREGPARVTIRYRNRLTRDHIGSRVVVRRWVDDDERGLVPSDVLGILEGWGNDGVLEVRTRHGDLVAIHERHILAAKTVPGSSAESGAPNDLGLTKQVSDQDEMDDGGSA